MLSHSDRIAAIEPAGGDAGHGRAGHVVSPAGDGTRLLEYLNSEPLRHLLHDTWGRTYPPFADAFGRLAERAGANAGRTAFAGARRPRPLRERPGRRAGARCASVGAPRLRASCSAARGSGMRSRAGFLRGRPDRRPPQSLEDAREEVELFHAYADAGLWNEADSTFVALDNPKHRFLRRRSSAICCCASSRTAIGGNRRFGPASAAIAVWRFASRCSANSTMPSRPIAPPTPRSPGTP